MEIMVNLSMMMMMMMMKIKYNSIGDLLADIKIVLCLAWNDIPFISK